MTRSFWGPLTHESITPHQWHHLGSSLANDPDDSIRMNSKGFVIDIKGSWNAGLSALIEQIIAHSSDPLRNFKSLKTPCCHIAFDNKVVVMLERGDPKPRVFDWSMDDSILHVVERARCDDEVLE